MNPQLVLIGVAGLFIVVLSLFIFSEAVWRPTRPNFLRANIVMPTGRIVQHDVKVKESAFNLQGHSYSVDPDTHKARGMLRVPNAFYIYNQKEPLDLSKMRATSGITATDFHDAIENHVAKDVLNAFKGDALTVAQGLLLVIAVVVVGFIGTYYLSNKKLTTIEQKIQILVPDITIDPSTGAVNGK